MKKFYYLIAMAIMAFTFTSCEDVPAPFGQPVHISGDTEGEGGSTSEYGTADAPLTVAQAIALIDAKSTVAEAYVKGKIYKIDSYNATYHSITYWISDDDGTTTQLQVYSGKGKDGADFAGKEDLTIGQTVTIKGALKNYNGTYEFDKNNEIVSIGDASGGGGSDTGAAKGTGTQSDPFNIAAAIAKCKEVGTTASTEKYYIKGIVVKGGTVSGGYGNVTFDMGDTKESTDLFKAYQVAGTDGEKLADGYEVKAGDEVVIYGPVVTYNTTYETSGKSAAQIVTINGKKTSETGGDTGGGDTSGSGGGTVSGNTLTINAADFGFATGVPATSATLVDGTVVAFDKGSNSNNSPQYYDGTYAAVRVYLNNEFTITASKNISKIEILTNDPASSGDKYNGSDTAVAEAGSNTINVVKESDTKISFSGLNAKTVKVKNSTTATSKNQLRIKTMIITYAN